MQKLCVKIAFKYASGFICTSEGIRSKLIEWGCKKEKIFYSCPYIAPTEKESSEEPLPVIKDFCQKHKYIITANASNTNKYKNEDLYGLDMCIEVVKYLIGRGYDVGLVYALTKITDIQSFEKMKGLITELGIADNILLFTEKTGLVPILKLTDIFLRPTNTDTWAMSISESISLGIPVIASDACKVSVKSNTYNAKNPNQSHKLIWIFV